MCFSFREIDSILHTKNAKEMVPMPKVSVNKEESKSESESETELMVLDKEDGEPKVTLLVSCVD